MGKKGNKDEFIVQATILAMAGIICRIIGILYRSPLTGIIGDEGNGYYSSAYNIYTIILLVSSYSIPSAISKVIAERLALKEYKNAHRIFKCALIYVIVIGGIASLFTFFCAGILVEKNAVVVLRVFAPTIFFSGILGVLRGYFQAHGTMVQTSFSQIIEQVLNAAVSVLAAYILVNIAAGESATTRAIYGAAGSAIGTGSGVVIALLVMYMFYILNRKMFRHRIEHDKRKEIDSYSHIFKIIFFMVTPVIMSTFIYNSSTVFNQTIYTKIMKLVKEVPTDTIYTNYGIFAGKAVVIMNIPIALASAMSSAMIPTIAGSFATGNQEETNEKVGSAINTTMLIAIPAAVGMAVLAKPIMQLLFPQKGSLELASNLLRVLSITVVFYGLSTLTNAVLQGIGKVNKPVINAALALIIQTIVLVPILLFTDWNLYCLAIAMIVYSLCMCVLNHRAIVKSLGYKENWMKTFVKPFWAAIMMGAIAHVVYKGIHWIYPSNTISLCGSILASVIVYFAMVIKLRIVTEEELNAIPKGWLLVKVARKVRLIK